MPINARQARAIEMMAQQRAAMERGMAQRGVQAGPVGVQRAQQAVRRDDQRRAGAARAAAANPFNAAFAAKREMAGESPKREGAAGVAGVLGSVLKPLQVFDYPRRAVMLGIEEMAGVLPEPVEWMMPITKLVDEARTEADKRSIRERFFDPTYGAGQVFHDINTGNELIDRWGNRAVGFAGDVALDPLSWLTLGSAKVPGAAGRVALATSAQAKGLGREVVEAAGRGGGQAVRNLGDEAAVRALGIAEPGLRFGPRKISARIPGTGALEEALSGALNKVRAPLTGTKTATQLRKWGAARDPDTRNAVERLLTGQGSLGSLESATHILGTEAFRKGKRTTGGMFVREATQLGDELGDDPNYVHALERGDLSDPRVARFQQLQDDTFEWQTNTGKWDPAVNPNAPQNFASVGRRPNRVPHVLTDEGREVFALPTTRVPGGTASMEPGAQQYSRVIVPGVDAQGQPITYRIGGHDFTPVEGSVKEANDWAESVGLPKLYEDSPRKLAAITVEQAQEAVGNARAIREMRGLRVEDPNDPTQTVPALLSTTQGTATREQLDEAASVAAGAARARQVQPQLETIQAKVAGSQKWLDQQGADLVTNITRENQVMFDIATDLDDEARAALSAANKQARKLGDPQKAMNRVYAEADRLHKNATTKLEKAQKALGDVIERQRQLELGTRRERAGVRRSVAQRRAELEAAVADATEVVRQRDIWRKRLQRTVERDVRATGAASEAQRALSAAEGLPPVSSTKQKGRPRRVKMPSEAKGDIIRGNTYLPKSKKLDKFWNNKVATFNGLMDQAQDMLRSGVDQRSREFTDIANRIRVAKIEMDELWARHAVPVPEAGALAAPVPSAAPAAAAPLDQATIDTLRQQAVTADEGLRATRAQRGEQEATKAALDQRFAEQRAARGELRGIEAGVEEQLGTISERTAAERAGLRAQRAPLEQTVEDFIDQLDTLPDSVRADVAQIHANHRDATTKVAGSKLNAERTANNVKAARKRLGAAGKMRTTPRGKGMGRPDSYEQLHADLVALAGQDVDPLIRQQLNAYGNGVAAAIRHEADEAKMQKFLTQLRSGELTPVMERVLKDGYVQLSTDQLVGRDLATTRAMQAAMKSVINPIKDNPGMFGKALDTYTKFFKTWATATPGFHIRNALSATFMNLTEGTSFSEMQDGVRIWQAWRKAPTDPNWMKDLPAELQDRAWDTVEAVYASGAGGQFSAAELGGRAFGEGKSRMQWLTENRWTKRSQNIGERVEGGVRAGLALHALNNGESVTQAIARIRRVHFDYSQVNETDQAVRRLIPFWTFMSRNLPLQVQQMFLKPRVYSQYNSLKRNFDVDPEGQMFMPEYMRQKGGFFLSPGVGVMPDVGATQIEEQLQMIGTPRRILSQLNPALKVPIELATNQDLYYGSQYRPNDFQKMGPETAMFAPLLQALGVAEQTPSGPVTEKKYANAIYDLVPLLAQVNRGFSTTPNREGKGLQSALNYFGIPVRTVTPEDERKEILYQRRASRRQAPEDARQEALRQFMATA